MYQFRGRSGERQASFPSDILEGFRWHASLREGDLYTSAFRDTADKSDPDGSGSKRSGGEGGFSPSFQEPSARLLRTNA